MIVFIVNCFSCSNVCDVLFACLVCCLLLVVVGL